MNIWNMLAGVPDQNLPHHNRQAPILNLRLPVSLAANASMRLEVGSQSFWSLIGAAVETGTLDVYLSDNAGTVADFRFQSGIESTAGLVSRE